MPKVHFVKSARKPIPRAGIEVGDSYYWWKFRYGGKQVSKTPPKRSQLTQSSFLAQLYDLEDGIEEQLQGASDQDELRSMVEDIAAEIQNLCEEARDSLEAMPEQLQDGDTGELLQSRIDACEEWADEVESIDVDDEDTADDVAQRILDANPGVE